ncbi:Mur ligase family protein [Fibrobacterales bacterium]|nr:Mur ligase family protein [Fibrobacterales bacterium]
MTQKSSKRQQSKSEKWLESRIRMGVKVGLDNIKELCRRLGNPQASLRIVHVAGTNGKGSTSSFCAYLLAQENKKVGLFTSPHLLSPRERIRIGDMAISEGDFEEGIEVIEDISKDIEPTYFEVLTALALWWFSKEQLEWVVLETGLGGRLDSTNVVNSEYAVITSIALEHTEFLGDTLEKILFEKCGIINSGAKIFDGLDNKNLSTRVEQYSNERQATYIGNIEKSQYSWLLDLKYGYMARNYILALDIVSEIVGRNFEKGYVLECVEKHSWAGRIQSVFYGAQLWLLDGAHNEQAMKNLVNFIQEKYPKIKFNLLLAMAEDKDVSSSIGCLGAITKSYFLAKPKMHRILSPKKLKGKILNIDSTSAVSLFESVTEAVADLANKKTPVLVCGSLYLMGEVVEAISPYVNELEWYRQFSLSSNERAPLIKE